MVLYHPIPCIWIWKLNWLESSSTFRIYGIEANTLDDYCLYSKQVIRMLSWGEVIINLYVLYRWTIGDKERCSLFYRQMCILMFHHRWKLFSDRCMANYPVTFNNSENCEQLSDMDKDLIYICVNAIAFFSSSFFPFFFCRFLQIVLHI